MSGEEPEDAPPAPRPGVEVARQALAAARAAARRSGARPVRDVPGAVGGGAAGAGDVLPRRRRTGPSEELRSGARPDDRDPQPLAGTVDRLVAERGWELDKAVGAMLGRWAELVGPEVAAHAAPESFEDGVLVVRASSTAWAVQLRELAPALRQRIDAEVGRGTCRTVTVLGPAPPSWRRGPLSVRGRGPRDTYG
ncbi:putative nucleic acid-binding Zn ribbon protein [Motilibacter rhizosphaerae]|uniref:Putative nucleic acid-binding Zn ribbon protein n=1 Tax=Motilibacter rhizosphaerae TaxID=598652 RepID=A0A4Q7NVF6_9ACTN|nr:DciA family protein [Motilibacter rhizosphaerae]RZS91233.1 putative nucleic acid-binding Zn ribbon protein [Motilibacter rhizosphaerae]